MKQESFAVGRSGPNKFYPTLYNKIPPQAPVKMLSARDEERRRHLSGSSKGLGSMNPMLVKSGGLLSPRSPRAHEDTSEIYHTPAKSHYTSGHDAMIAAKEEIASGFYESSNTLSYKSRAPSRNAEALISPRRLPPIRGSIPSMLERQANDVAGKAHPSYSGTIPGYSSVYGKSRAKLVREVADPSNRRKFYVEYGGETRPQGNSGSFTERSVAQKESNERGSNDAVGQLDLQAGVNVPDPSQPFDSRPVMSKRDSFHNYPIRRRTSQEMTDDLRKSFGGDQ